MSRISANASFVHTVVKLATYNAQGGRCTQQHLQDAYQLLEAAFTAEMQRAAREERAAEEEIARQEEAREAALPKNRIFEALRDRAMPDKQARNGIGDMKVFVGHVDVGTLHYNQTSTPTRFTFRPWVAEEDKPGIADWLEKVAATWPRRGSNKQEEEEAARLVEADRTILRQILRG